MTENGILFCGDPHGHFEQIIRAAQSYRPDAVVLLGDYNLRYPLENYFLDIMRDTEIYWIHGNHDVRSKTEYNYLFNSALAANNLHLTVININGLRVAGLGGIFMGRIWNPTGVSKWKDKQYWLESQPSNVKKVPVHFENAIWHHELERMKKEVHADILVSHEAPSCHKHGYAVIDELAIDIGAKHIFHGHHHIYYRDQLRTGINVTGVALEGVVNLAGEVVI